MTAETTIDTTPRAWIGCLHCYNDGRLVGEWFDAEGADKITLADVHGGAAHFRSDCEEMWVMDHENIPVRGEMSPYDAAQWAEVLAAVDEHLRPALCAWVETGTYVAEGFSDLPSIPDFEERYCGEHETFTFYAHELAEGIGLLHDVPEEVVRYFNWDSWTRDLGYDYTTADSPSGGVFVFRNQ